MKDLFKMLFGCALYAIPMGLLLAAKPPDLMVPAFRGAKPPDLMVPECCKVVKKSVRPDGMGTCSNQCSCGCNDGLPCTCGASKKATSAACSSGTVPGGTDCAVGSTRTVAPGATVPVYYQTSVEQYSDAPSFRGIRGGSRGGSRRGGGGGGC